MSNFTIRTVNSTFRTVTALEEVDEADDAFALAVRGAVGVISDDIARGQPVSSIQVTLEDGGARPLRAAVVTLSVAPLTVD